MTVRELDSPPSLTALYPRAVGVPLLRRVPVIGGASKELPDTELEVRDVETSPEHLAAYNAVCGFSREDVLPPTYPHIVAFPLAVRIMAERAFPFPLLGLVHIGNEIEQLRPIGAGEPLTVRVRAQDLEPHERGTQFAMAAEARVGEERVWRSRNVYLHRHGKPSGDQAPRVSPPGRAPAEEPGPLGRRSHWRVPGDIGRRYGAVSGDRNPIHLHGWSAKLFGMPRPIAHGMWVKARCLAELEPTLPDAFTVSVRFKLPLFLPAQVAFGERWPRGPGSLAGVRPGGETRGFEVRDASSGKPHLSGELREGA
jgi:acyl dehydratase